MITVVDQQSPWLTPSSTLAATTQPHDGASITRKGTGRPSSQPATRMRLRPTRSLNCPAARLASALTTPKLAMKERMAVRETSPNSRSARSGRTARSSPTIPPTKALTRTSRANCAQLAPRPRRTAGAPDGAAPLALDFAAPCGTPVLAAGAPRGAAPLALRDGTAVGPGLELGRVARERRAGLVERDDARVVRRRGRDPRQDLLDEGRLVQRQRGHPRPHLGEGRRHRALVEGDRLAGV